MSLAKSLFSEHPLVAAEAYGWDASEVTPMSHSKMKWQCPIGHIYEARVADRTRNQSGCPYCTNQKVLVGFNDISFTHPNIALEAAGWDPTEYVPGSMRKLSWKCPRDHIYQMTPQQRCVLGQSCPYCSKQKLLKGFNDLLTTHPELAIQADGWDPSQIIGGGGKKLSWKCERGHKFQAAISQRKNGGGCHICSNKKVLAGFNDIATTEAEASLEAHEWDPRTLTRGSNKPAKWKCKNNHVWSASPKSRFIDGASCPKCRPVQRVPGSRKHEIAVGINDFASLHPEIAVLASGWDPTQVTVSDKRVLAWKCSKGHITESRISSKIRSQGGCVYCMGKYAITGENDLLTTHPEVASEADGWDPSKVSKGANQKLSWKCAKGHKWTAYVHSRAIRGAECPFCSGRNAIPGETDLLTQYPEIAIEADGWNPREMHAGSVSKVSWKCAKGHTWKTSPAHRTRRSTGCPVCGNDVALKGFNDLTTTHPEIAKEAFGWDPSTVVSGSHKIVTWKCSLGHVYQTPVHQRALSNGGCMYCSGHKTLAGFNDIATLAPDLAKEASGWDPTKYVTSSHRSVTWKCALGHEWNARIFSRVKNGLGCPFCAGKDVLIGFNDLMTTHPSLAIQAVGWDPQKYSKGMQVKKKWRCEEGHEWIAYIHSRSQGIGCPSCSKSGFDPNQDGYLYFLEHPVWEMFQIGITNYPEDRLGSHRKLGWEVIELRGPMDGHLTHNWETSILRMLKKRGADLSNSKIAGKFDGFSEAWSKSTFQVTTIKELMKLTDSYEEGL